MRAVFWPSRDRLHVLRLLERLQILRMLESRVQSVSPRSLWIKIHLILHLLLLFESLKRSDAFINIGLDLNILRSALGAGASAEQ